MLRLRNLIALVLVVVVGVVAWMVWPRGTSEVDEDEALERFRDRSDTTAAEALTDTGVPAPGVYRFAATGGEDVKLGPFPSQSRTLGETVTAIVVDGDEGCFDFTVNFFAEHTEDTTFCLADGSLLLAEHVKHQTIGNLSPTATMTCDPALLADPDSSVVDLDCDLELDGGPAAITASLVGMATRSDPEEVDVGGESVVAAPVVIELTASGGLSGAWTEKIWFSEDVHMPVRIERTFDLAGPATLSESSILELVSLTPSS